MTSWLAWYVLSLLLILLLPSQIWLGEAAWEVSGRRLPQILSMGGAFLGLSLFLILRFRRPDRVRWPGILIRVLVVFVATHFLLALRPSVPRSRGVLLLSAALASALAWAPRLIARRRSLALAGMALAVSATVVAGLTPADDGRSGTPDRTLATTLARVTVSYQSGLVEPRVTDGGAITAAGSGFVLATGGGRFYRLRWAASGDSVVSTPLALESPLDREGFLEDQPDPKAAPRLRVTDLLFDEGEGRDTLYVSHQHWNQLDECFTMRVSATTLPPRGPGGSWTTVHETRPCLPPSGGFVEVATGGRLAWHPDGGLLMTVGDHGFDGLDGPALAQERGSSYGKVLLLRREGETRTFTLGHRNPQGLAVSEDGRIWSTEHGPKGGDEINVLEAGENYGWPLVTYGAAYEMDRWPLAPDPGERDRFVGPVFAFLPSIGISSLLQVRGPEFPEWRGDLLVGSLRGESLFRIRTRGRRVLYAEPLRIGREVRDLAEGRDGRIVLWTDEGDVVVVRRGPAELTGRALFEGCRSCHEPGLGPDPVGPSLRGIVGRPIGSVRGYDYSPALEAMQGSWTEERLDRFLANPRAFAPGTSMEFPGISSPGERAALLEFLREYR